MKKNRYLLNKLLLIFLGIIFMINLQSCLPSVFAKIFKYASRDISSRNFENSREATKAAIIEDFTLNGKDDFSSVKPFTGFSFEVVVEHEPYTYPFCDEIYSNVPADLNAFIICNELQNTDSCNYSYSSDSELTGFDFVVYENNIGAYVFFTNNVIDYRLYINGQCRLRGEKD